MRIAQLAPLAESVPPKLYGGTERVVAWLVDELIDLGHDVTLFASGDSRTMGKLHPVWPRALRLGRRGADPSAACALLVEAIAKRASDFDVIYSHVEWLPLPLLSRLGVPFLTTMHGRLDLPGLPDVVREFPSARFVSISDRQRRPLPAANWIATIQHGLPSSLLLRPTGRELIWRSSDASRWTRAQRTPSASRAQLVSHCGWPPRFRAARPCTSKSILSPKSTAARSSLSAIDDARKQPFLAEAAALLFPIDWPEPFGLVMIEAMACGTPVIAYRSGSVPEVVEHGVTGFIVENEEQAVRAAGELERLDRRRVRAHFEERFSASRMAREYEGKYRELIAAAAPIHSSFEIPLARRNTLPVDELDSTALHVNSSVDTKRAPTISGE